MKKLKRGKIAGLMAAAGMLMATNASATLTWPGGITINSPNIVGAHDVVAGESSSDVHETDVANTLLGMDAGLNQPAPPFSNGGYVTSNTEYGTGGIGSPTATFGFKGAAGITHVNSGWEYAMAKYDGPNAGYVLFYLGGQDADLPNLPYSLWGNVNDTGLSLSHYTVFNAVPEPTTMIAGALLLLPFGASTLRFLRKNRTA
jgi:hypothetical protein